MNIADVIKSQEFFQNLAKKKQQNCFSNAVLFFCDDIVTSKITLILTALMLQYQNFELFTENSAEFVRIESGVDLDVKVFPKGDRLVVADSEEIVSEAFVKPVNLPFKIFVLSNVDDATEEAQNKLLKILEEPPENVFFLLSAKNEAKVLSTIKSRCEKVTIPLLLKQQMKTFCDNSLAITLGEGQIGKTLSLSKNEDLFETASFAVSILTELKNSKQVIKFSKKFLDNFSQIDLMLEVLSLAVEDLIKIKCESQNLCKLDMFVHDLADVEPEFSVRALCEIFHLVSKFREKMEFNANVTVAVDNFLLKILEVKFICK